MRRWNFMGGTPYGLAWSGVLCDKHEPWDKGHLKPRALAQYLAAFPSDLPDDVRGVGFDPRSTPITESCHVCKHERRQAELRRTISEMYEE